MSDITIWHNPRCSKSRQTLALLQNRGVEPIVRKYQEDAPNEAEIRAVLSALNVTAIKIMRSKDAAFRDTGLSEDSTETALIAAMVQNPALIERPIVISGTRAALGRPPETVLDLL